MIVRLAAPALTFLWVDRGLLSEGRRWVDAALEHRHRLSRPALAKALFVRSFLSLRSGGHDRQTDRQLSESLSLFQELEDTEWTVAALSMLGQAAERAGQLDRAVRLWGAAVNLRTLAIPPFVVRPLEEQLLTPLRDTLGHDEFDAQWATGQALPLEDAITSALNRH